MARTAKITNANVGPLKNVRGAVGNTPVRAQDFNTLIGDHVSQSDASDQTIVGNAKVAAPNVTEDQENSGSAKFRIRFTNVTSGSEAYTLYRLA